MLQRLSAKTKKDYKETTLELLRLSQLKLNQSKNCVLKRGLFFLSCRMLILIRIRRQSFRKKSNTG